MIDYAKYTLMRYPLDNYIQPDDIVEKMQQILKDTPSASNFEVVAGMAYESPNLTLEYYRPKTEAELEALRQAEESRRASRKKYYEELKKEFGNE